MSIECFLGFDGGQSGSRCLLVDTAGHVLFRAAGPPFEHLNAFDGPKKIRRAFSECLSRVATNHYLVRSAFLGLTGVWDSDSPEARPILEIFRSVLHADCVNLDNDSVSCWAGAFACNPGVVLSAGTGVVSYGVSPGGQSVKVGGWGYIMGDLGSAFDIGHRALVLIAAESDRGGPRSLLASRILDHMGVSSPRELQARLYRSEERLIISSLASIVTECAYEGDQGAVRILQESGQHLAGPVIAAIERLNWYNGSVVPSYKIQKPVPVACVGGVFKAGLLVEDTFQASVLSEFENVSFVEPRFEPVVGAVLLAWRQAGLKITSNRLRNLTEGA